MTSLSASDWNFFRTWDGKNLIANEQSSTMGTPVWVIQASGWVQGTINYQYTVSSGTNYFPTSTAGGGGMAWEAVDFLLQHLGFTVTTKHPEYVTYEYRGDARYGLSLHRASQWPDMQVREILAYAYKVIGQYEEMKHPVTPPREKPLSELEVEEW